jgi:ESCRT-II complex subunit VPS22
VDPLASKKGFWNELLGLGDFYYELGVQIAEACLLARPFNGGLMEMGVSGVRAPPPSPNRLTI